MKFLLSYKIFEKTSLIGIGVPYSVMQNIQKDYAISDNAKWKLIDFKKDINRILRQSKNTLIISTCNNKIFIIYSLNKEYFIETYILTEKDDFGNEQWFKTKREKMTITDIMKKIERNCNSYELISGNWLHEFYKTRKLKKNLNLLCQ